MSNYLRRKEVLLNIVNLKSIELIPNLTVEILHTIFFYQTLYFFDFCLSGIGLRLKDVGDFYHKCSCEERMFVEPQNCHTKHRTANFL